MDGALPTVGGVKQRNAGIDLFRYVCAVMVVAIHTQPLSEFSAAAGEICSKVITVIAVPFFFAVSGFFYLQKIERGEKAFGRTFVRLLCVYACWSVPYYLIDFVQWGHKNLIGYGIAVVQSFCITGSYYHFWFFPALLCSLCIATLLFRVGAKRILIPLALLLYGIGCLGTSYYAWGKRIPVLQALFAWDSFDVVRRIFFDGLPFFIAGYAVWRIVQRGIPHTDKAAYVLLGGCVVYWATEMALVFGLHLQRNIVITPALYPLVLAVLLVLLRRPCPQYASTAAKCRVMANVTYYIHPLVLWIMDRVMRLFGSSIGYGATIRFVFAVAIAAALGAAVYRVRDRRVRFLVG